MPLVIARKPPSPLALRRITLGLESRKIERPGGVDPDPDVLYGRGDPASGAVIERRTVTEPAAALDGWLYHYNHHRKHSALGHQPPIARLHERNQP